MPPPRRNHRFEGSLWPRRMIRAAQSYPDSIVLSKGKQTTEGDHSKRKRFAPSEVPGAVSLDMLLSSDECPCMQCRVSNRCTLVHRLGPPARASAHTWCHTRRPCGKDDLRARRTYFTQYICSACDFAELTICPAVALSPCLAASKLAAVSAREAIHSTSMLGSKTLASHGRLAAANVTLPRVAIAAFCGPPAFARLRYWGLQSRQKPMW